MIVARLHLRVCPLPGQGCGAVRAPAQAGPRADPAGARCCRHRTAPLPSDEGDRHAGLIEQNPTPRVGSRVRIRCVGGPGRNEFEPSPSCPLRDPESDLLDPKLRISEAQVRIKCTSQANLGVAEGRLWPHAGGSGLRVGGPASSLLDDLHGLLPVSEAARPSGLALKVLVDGEEVLDLVQQRGQQIAKILHV